MLLNYAAVLHGHLPAGELDEPRAQFLMLVIERRALQSASCRGVCAHNKYFLYRSIGMWEGIEERSQVLMCPMWRRPVERCPHSSGVRVILSSRPSAGMYLSSSCRGTPPAGVFSDLHPGVCYAQRQCRFWEELYARRNEPSQTSRCPC